MNTEHAPRAQRFIDSRDYSSIIVLTGRFCHCLFKPYPTFNAMSLIHLIIELWMCSTSIFNWKLLPTHGRCEFPNIIWSSVIMYSHFVDAQNCQHWTFAESQNYSFDAMHASGGTMRNLGQAERATNHMPWNSKSIQNDFIISNSLNFHHTRAAKSDLIRNSHRFHWTCQ